MTAGRSAAYAALLLLSACGGAGERAPDSPVRAAIARDLFGWVEHKSGTRDWASNTYSPGESVSWSLVHRRGAVKPDDRDALRDEIQSRVIETIERDGKLGNRCPSGSDCSPATIDYESSGRHGGAFVWVTGDDAGTTVVSVAVHEAD
jgi:hypothetical protein